MIHEDLVIKPQRAIPPGSRFKGYWDFVIQELGIRTQNTRYRLEHWKTPDGQTLSAQLPGELRRHHLQLDLLLGFVGIESSRTT